MVEREAYPNAPLRLVSLEIRFPLTSRVLSRPVWDAFEQALGEELPDVEVLVEDPETHIPRGSHEPVLRRISDGRQRAVTLYHGALTVELADYQKFDDLVNLTTATLRATEVLPGGLSCTRMGLRYINEVESAPLHEDAREWAKLTSWTPYLNAELLRTVSDPPTGLCPFDRQGHIGFHATEGREYVALYYGPHSEGVVDPEGVLTLEELMGPCFVLDIDAFLPGSMKEPVASGTKGLLAALDGLHEAVESVFEWSVTDRLKEVFRVPVHVATSHAQSSVSAASA